MRLWPRKAPQARPGRSRRLVPFTDGALDPAVLQAAIRMAQASEPLVLRPSPDEDAEEADATPAAR